MNSIAALAGLPTASDYQIDIFTTFSGEVTNLSARNDTQSLMVRAVAGSGKTTTMVGLTNLCQNKSVLALAFNKSIAVELGERMGRHVNSKTLNAIGWGITYQYGCDVLGRKINMKDFTDGKKVQKIIRGMMSPTERREMGDDVKFLVGMAKSLGMVPQIAIDTWNCVPVGPEATPENWKSVLSHFGRDVPVDVIPSVIAWAEKILVESIRIYFTDGVVDFDDQKWLSVILRDEEGRPLRCKKYDIIMIDEVQDVNAVDIALVEMCRRSGSSIVVGVGDNRQAIYGFRGADVNSTENFKNYFNAVEKPLSISYRCARAIVEHARKIFPEIEAAPNAEEGEVKYFEGYTSEIFTSDDMIICRNNAPTVQMAFRLIRSGVPCVVKGRDIGANLISMLKKLGAINVNDMNLRLNTWAAQQRERILAEDEDNEEAVERMMDRVHTAHVFIEQNLDGECDSVYASIESMFGDGKDLNNRLVLCTVHKSKGLESDRVFILDSFLFMPKRILPNTWQEEQEKNLIYVARTRAKSMLGYVKTENML